MDPLVDLFGIRQTPWVIRAYIVLLFACFGLMILGMKSDTHAGEQVLSLAMDSFKTVLGAVIGALSMAASHRWGSQDSGNSVSGGKGD
jgi:hypothetical protein